MELNFPLTKTIQLTPSQVIFIPAHRIQNLDERDTAATTEILREEMRKGSQSIISYESCNGSLEKMREDAFMWVAPMTRYGETPLVQYLKRLTKYLI